MFDTVGFGFYKELDISKLEGFWRKTSRAPFDKWRRTRYEHSIKLKEGRSCNLTYYPQNLSGDYNPLLIYEFSIPKFIYGTNIIPVYDIDQMVEVSNKRLGELESYPYFFPHIDVCDGYLTRIDVVYNHRVGAENIDYYLRAFPKLHYPHHKTQLFDSGVYFITKEFTTKFYAKEWESHDERAAGILRQEQTIHANKIKEITGKRGPTIFDFTRAMAQARLNYDLKQLHINPQVITTQDQAIRILREKYKDKPKKADNRIGFYLGTQGMTPEQIMKIYHKSTRTINKYLQEIVDAGLSTIISEKTLPNLTIDFDQDEIIAKKMAEENSDTLGLSEELLDETENDPKS